MISNKKINLAYRSRERVIVSRPFVYPEQLYVQPQGQTQKIIVQISGIAPRRLSQPPSVILEGAMEKFATTPAEAAEDISTIAAITVGNRPVSLMRISLFPNSI